MAKTRRSKRNLRKTRRNQRGGNCKVKSANNASKLESSTNCGPGSQIRFPDLKVGQQVQIVGPLDKDIVLPSYLPEVITRLNKAKPPVSNPQKAAEASIKEKMRTEKKYVFEVTEVKLEGAFRSVKFKVVGFPEQGSSYNCVSRTPKNNWHISMASEYDNLCDGFVLNGPINGDRLYTEYSFYRVN
jgi:hypothetical protein